MTELSLETIDVETAKRQIKNEEKPVRTSAVYRVTKRLFDFILPIMAGVILLIPMILIAVLITIKDFGNPFYKQKRIGKNGKEISIYKFRSMKQGSDNLKEMLSPEQLKMYLMEYKLDDDPRLIGYEKAGDGNRCFGSKIRSMSIDELPQMFLNVCILRNMSVIGPRPILQSELEKNYSKEEQKVLLSVKPGLTGYWQAYARNNVGYEDGKRQQMELYYVKNQSLWFDIKILFKTVESLLCKRGAK